MENAPRIIVPPLLANEDRGELIKQVGLVRRRAEREASAGRILVAANDRTMTSVNGHDPMEYRRAVSLLGPLARVSSADKRASFAGTFIAQNERPNRQQRQAMKSKRGRRMRMIELPR